MSVSLNEMKHPLANEWAFWLFKNTESNWEKNLQKLTSFNTVEDYWCLYHHMKLPSELNSGQDYAIFKKGIEPMWEDEANTKGGRWQIMFDDLKDDVLNRIWLDTVLLLIGNTIKYSDSICGVVVNVRARSKIAVWLSTKNSNYVMEIGRTLKHQLKIFNKLRFFLHNGPQLHSC